MRSPRVTIGLPVYNGENYLAETLDSLRAQTFSDLEIIISDNASTDATAEICQAAANEDARVRYVRQHVNLGAAPNYNAVFELARGSLFKWAAHDDVCHPEFVQRCVEALDAHPHAVGAFPLATYIGPAGEQIALSPARPGLERPDPHRRLEEVLGAIETLPVFGVYRRQAVAATSGHGGYTGSDRILLAELVLTGRLVEVRERLLSFRYHPSQSIAMSSGGRFDNVREAWFDTSRHRRIVFPYWRRLAGYASALRRAPLIGGQRMRCIHSVLKWTAGSWKGLTLDLVSVPVQIWRLVSSRSERSPILP